MKTDEAQLPASQSADSVAVPAHGMARELFRHRRFVAVCLVLAVAGIGLNALVQGMQLYFMKESVPMRKSFGEVMPEIIGTWVRVARDENLDPDTLAALATDKFFFCAYVDSRALGLTPQQVHKRFKGKIVSEQMIELRKIQATRTHAVLQFALTYYTGKADTVAHVPERCYVGDGYEPKDPATLAWGLGRNLWVRHITFKSLLGRPPADVVYFFHVNGHYESGSFGVRRELQNLFQRYGYYAKVELMCATDDASASARSMQDFLALALPRVEEALPDWTQYRSRR